MTGLAPKRVIMKNLGGKSHRLSRSIQVALLLSGCVSAVAQDSAEFEPVIEEVIVQGKFVPDEKRDTSEIADVLDLADMELLGDGDIGNMLTRVTGLSLVGGKYVYVRGLGERYSSTMLNNTRISSPVPFQKTVPLDIVPANLAKSLLVQKTWSSQYPGDFSGGVVDIRSKAAPEEDYAGVKWSIGGNTESTGGEGLTYRGGGRDNTGYDDGTRAIPQNVDRIAPENIPSTQSFPENQVLGASFYNNWDVYEKQMLKPDMAGEIELAKRVDLADDRMFGLIVSAKYNNEWRYRETDYNRYTYGTAGSEGTPSLAYEKNVTTHTISTSLFMNAGVVLDANNALSLTSLVLRQTDDEVDQRRGLSSESDIRDGVYVENYRLQWTENQITSHQLTGDHFFPEMNELALNWRVVTGGASRDAPDTRSYTYADNNNGLQELVEPNRQAAGDLKDVNQAPDRVYAKLEDDIEDMGFDIELPVEWGDIMSTFTAGYSHYERTRETEERFFRFQLASGSDVGLQTPSQLFSLQNWQSGDLQLRDFTSAAANSSGIFPRAESGEEITAVYVGMDSQVLPRMRLQAGIRHEDVTLFADAWGGNTQKGTTNAVKNEYEDLLPAVSLTWEFTENMQVRGAYSETVNRPSLLEITGSTIRNPDNQQLYRGNVFLEPADINNYDLRWEWYFGPEDSFTVGAFYKNFDNAIEIAKVQAQNDIYTWYNARGAELEGVEFELRKALPFAEWFEGAPGWTNYFSVSTNLTLMDSEVDLGDDESIQNIQLTANAGVAPFAEGKFTRPIAGQSDTLANVMVSYQDYGSGLTSTLAYNYTDDRLMLVGERNAPDIYEEGRGTLDFLLRYEFQWGGNFYEAELTAKNLLNEEVLWTQGNNVYERYDPGMSWGIDFKAALN